ncbi:hypothetical protein HF086_014937 [Spodoptera exigua]|uniref:Uncharacterized protein n=1 Tax=Spodoptera exigua TaxID=7107 RepID=A0A922MKC8_SPOEX|nr:hypothetical protein HF086_014937 [Spodoptera exigua]
MAGRLRGSLEFTDRCPLFLHSRVVEVSFVCGVCRRAVVVLRDGPAVAAPRGLRRLRVGAALRARARAVRGGAGARARARARGRRGAANGVLADGALLAPRLLPATLRRAAIDAARRTRLNTDL